MGVILLLLYFFVVREQKRTAIERSLGMSKRQCRVSLLSGLLVLTLLASAAGAVGGGMLASMETTVEEAAQVQGMEDVESGYSTQYSLWAKSDGNSAALEEESAPALSGWVLAGVPLGFLCVVWILSALLAYRNMKIDPIYLLGGKGEERQRENIYN